MTAQCSTCLFGRVIDSARHCCHSAPPAGPDWQPTGAQWPLVLDTDWCSEGADATTGAPFNTAIGAIATVAALPAASTVPLLRMFVSDSIAPSNVYTVGNPVSAGGTTTMPVYSDGSIWRLG